MKKIFTLVAGCVLATSAFAASAPTGQYVIVACNASSLTNPVVSDSSGSTTTAYTTCGSALDAIESQGYILAQNMVNSVGTGYTVVYTLVKAN